MSARLNCAVCGNSWNSQDIHPEAQPSNCPKCGILAGSLKRITREEYYTSMGVKINNAQERS